jgi:hypothetical protein
MMHLLSQSSRLARLATALNPLFHQQRLARTHPGPNIARLDSLPQPSIKPHFPLHTPIPNLPELRADPLLNSITIRVLR